MCISARFCRARKQRVVSFNRLCGRLSGMAVADIEMTRKGLGLCGQRLPQLNLIPIQVIDPGKATVGFIHSFGVNLYSLLF